MREEIAAAVVFLTRIVKKDNDSIDKTHMEKFSDALTTLLRERFKNHWYEDKPHKGQGYRCIRMNNVSADPVLLKAAEDSGLKLGDLHLPGELTLWVDPAEVTCRVGESQGSAFCTVASFKDGNSHNQAHTFDIEKFLEQHNYKRNLAFSYFQQSSSSRSGAHSPKDDAGIVLEEGFYHYSYSPIKQPRHYGGYKSGHNRIPSRQMHKFYRGSPPVDMHFNNRRSPPFLPNASVPVNSSYHGDKQRHWMRGPDLVKA